MCMRIILKFSGILFQDINIQKKAWNLFSFKEFNRDISCLNFDKYIYGQSYQSALEHIADRTLSNREVEKLSIKQINLYRKLC